MKTMMYPGLGVDHLIESFHVTDNDDGTFTIRPRYTNLAKECGVNSSTRWRMSNAFSAVLNNANDPEKESAT